MLVAFTLEAMTGRDGVQENMGHGACIYWLSMN